MLTRRSLLILTFATVSLANYGQAAPVSAPAAVTPEEVARNYVTALKELRMKDVVARMHPEALKNWRGKIMATVAHAGRAGQAEAMLPLFHGVQSIAELKKLDDSRLCASMLTGAVRLRPSLKQRLTTANFEVVGHVMQGTDIAHVVCRATQLENGKWEAGVIPISLKRTAKGWGTLLSADLEGWVTRDKTRQLAGDAIITRGQIEAYGHVREGREAHVVFRSTIGERGERVTRVYAFTLPEEDVAWETVVGGDLVALSQLVSARLAEHEARKK